jgi:hypothetical protein
VVAASSTAAEAASILKRCQQALIVTAGEAIPDLHKVYMEMLVGDIYDHPINNCLGHHIYLVERKRQIQMHEARCSVHRCEVTFA